MDAIDIHNKIVRDLIKEFVEDLKEFNIVCKGFSVIRVQTIYDLSTEKQKKWEKRLNETK